MSCHSPISAEFEIHTKELVVCPFMNEVLNAFALIKAESARATGNGIKCAFRTFKTSAGCDQRTLLASFHKHYL